MVERNPVTPQRRSLRLNDYDYHQAGGYFVTVCTYRRENLFGEIREGVMRLNQYGEVAHKYFEAIPQHFDNAAVDEFVVMPNHVHGVIFLSDVGARHAVPPTRSQRFGHSVVGSLATIVRSFKSIVSKRINDSRKTPGEPVWQRNYYEHVIRNERSLQRIREYIVNNPQRWDFDRENPAATTPGADIDGGFA